MALGATLINTARGSLVDTDAVLSSLESGHLGAYCCDAFVKEPPAPHSLWNHPNVHATPHIGGFTIESGQRSAALAVDAILEILG
jgi:phosphoglycerate dehydrogenase-like enzyme